MKNLLFKLLLLTKVQSLWPVGVHLAHKHNYLYLVLARFLWKIVNKPDVPPHMSRFWDSLLGIVQVKIRTAALQVRLRVRWHLCWSLTWGRGRGKATVPLQRITTLRFIFRAVAYILILICNVKEREEYERNR